jgi:hypothetical protein
MGSFFASKAMLGVAGEARHNSSTFRKQLVPVNANFCVQKSKSGIIHDEMDRPEVVSNDKALQQSVDAMNWMSGKDSSSVKSPSTASLRGLLHDLEKNVCIREMLRWEGIPASGRMVLGSATRMRQEVQNRDSERMVARQFWQTNERLVRRYSLSSKIPHVASSASSEYARRRVSVRSSFDKECIVARRWDDMDVATIRRSDTVNLSAKALTRNIATSRWWFKLRLAVDQSGLCSNVQAPSTEALNERLGYSDPVSIG